MNSSMLVRKCQVLVFVSVDFFSLQCLDEAFATGVVIGFAGGLRSSDAPKAPASVLLQTHAFLLSHSGRGFDENVKVDVPGQITKHFRHFCSLAFSTTCSDFHCPVPLAPTLLSPRWGALIDAHGILV